MGRNWASSSLALKNLLRLLLNDSDMSSPLHGGRSLQVHALAGKGGSFVSSPLPRGGRSPQVETPASRSRSRAKVCACSRPRAPCFGDLLAASEPEVRWPSSPVTVEVYPSSSESLLALVVALPCLFDEDAPDRLWRPRSASGRRCSSMMRRVSTSGSSPIVKAWPTKASCSDLLIRLGSSGAVVILTVQLFPDEWGDWRLEA
mmetsp:Transcript_76117/g.223154  ORF Transcript_76117/g.223154 Transcript_76117/m.223154 type:complete len:203 (+) Transcript_76117:2-610(+)